MCGGNSRGRATGVSRWDSVQTVPDAPIPMEVGTPSFRQGQPFLAKLLCNGHPRSHHDNRRLPLDAFEANFLPMLRCVRVSSSQLIRHTRCLTTRIT